MRFIQSVIIFVTFFITIESAKILGLLYFAGRSHYQAGSTLMKILAEHGHEMTVVSPFGEKKPPKNYKDVILTGGLEKMEQMKFNFFEMNLNPLLGPIIFNGMSSTFMDDTFNNTNFKNLMNSKEHFDLVIMEQFNADALKYVAYHFNAPLIAFTALETNKWINPYQGNPDNPAYLSTVNMNYGNNMSFIQRVLNTLMYVYEEIIRIFLYLPTQNSIIHKYYPDAPHLNEIVDKVALVFTNTDPSTHEPLPRVPSIISVGGFHINKPKPLPKDLKDILDNAKNGVIYFSMGSNIKSKEMPIKQRDYFLQAFAKLKETVIWKFEDENLPGKPDNVIIKKWLPQNDMFAHGNIKLFITHGGVFSTMEALYYGIPILAIPIFGDQSLNAKRATENGYARWLDFKKMTGEELETEINDLLTNPKYAENCKARSKIMQDKPISPQETINFWVDYVIRHKGADHLRVAGLNLSWYQYVLLDVVAFIFIVTITVSIICWYMLKMLFRKCMQKKQIKEKKS